MKCPNCRAEVRRDRDQCGGHGEHLYECPSCQKILTPRYGYGTFLVFAILLVPSLKYGIEFLTTDRYPGPVLVVAIAVTIYVYSKINTLVIARNQRR